jgi:hypothetical protein
MWLKTVVGASIFLRADDRDRLLGVGSHLVAMRAATGQERNYSHQH